MYFDLVSAGRDERNQLCADNSLISTKRLFIELEKDTFALYNTFDSLTRPRIVQLIV